MSRKSWNGAVQCTVHTAVQCDHDYSPAVTSTKPKANLSGPRPTLPPASPGTLGKFLRSWFLRLLSTTQKAVMGPAPGSLGGQEKTVQDTVPSELWPLSFHQHCRFIKRSPSATGQNRSPKVTHRVSSRTRFRIQDTWNPGPERLTPVPPS